MKAPLASVYPLAVVSVALDERALRGGAALGDLRVGAKQVAEGKLIAVALGAGGNEMQVMGAPRRGWLAEPVHLLGQIGRVEVFELGERCKAARAVSKVPHFDQDVHDRLGFKAGHGGAADVVDAAANLSSDCLLQYCLGEAATPGLRGRGG
jgi:hypothetical protein